MFYVCYFFYLIADTMLVKKPYLTVILKQVNLCLYVVGVGVSVSSFDE